MDLYRKDLDFLNVMLFFFSKSHWGTFLVAQWFGLQATILGWEAKIPHAVQHDQKIFKKWKKKKKLKLKKKT